MKSYDSVVIGGGPAGMTAALYLMRSGVSTLMVEQLSPGGQVLLTEEIENYPGFPKAVKGYELVDAFAAQLDAYHPERMMDEVRELRLDSTGKAGHELLVGDEWIRAKSLILCTGARYRKLGVPGEQRLLGRGVSYCALCDGNFYRDRVVAVVGGGNSALEESLYLAKLVKKLYLIHRRDDFRGLKCYQDKCFTHEAIEVVRSSVVNEILGDGEVTGVSVENRTTGERSVLDVDGVFVFVGFEPNVGFIPESLDMDANGVLTDTEMRTNIPGVFAAGDVRSKHCRQVATAVGDGATAANSAFAYLEQLDA
ncbi:thioredoxin reductase (NADPH) [Paucidesulfovibrio gracilis DSM 16080]|uniref:Thioredoxin reductase n=1 Tax=Paucidesulfovibrio gracilis DSM 16080 TaxID=1121449 RepID=A0A1T4WS56_9BACT|nr:thioredoxin-disulfide reductase [Paucidesulfovibrio gracilis]SKA80212.1 thioredoxin reductase (NADPH) [Paucidesulfovibrio gracilis DSM 16080]